MKHEKSCLIDCGTTTKAEGFVWLAHLVFKSLEGLFLALDTHTGGKESWKVLKALWRALWGFGGLATNKKKKGGVPCPGGFFWDIASNDHTCITKTTPNEPKKLQNKTNQNRKKSVPNKENKNGKTL